jgi:prevent-host-death family protein
MTLLMPQRSVGIRELHDHLSEYLELVGEGTDLVVTKRGKPVARITAAGEHSRLQQMIDAGLVRPGRKPRRKLSEILSGDPIELRPGGGSLSDAILEERQEEYDELFRQLGTPEDPDT